MNNAERIRQSATRQMLDKAMKEYDESVDKYEDEMRRAYWNLVGKVGKHRADEFTVDLVQLPF